MKNLVSLIMVFPFLLFFLLQPMLHNSEMARAKKLEILVQKATEQAAIEGTYTPDNIQNIIDGLTDVGFDPGKIEIEATTNTVYRGGYVSCKVKVPANLFFILLQPLIHGTDTETYHIRGASRMSEYVG